MAWIPWVVVFVVALMVICFGLGYYYRMHRQGKI